MDELMDVMELGKPPDSGFQTPFSQGPWFTQNFTGLPWHQTEAQGGTKPGQIKLTCSLRGQ